jgi:hypothetical protein
VAPVILVVGSGASNTQALVRVAKRRVAATGSTGPRIDQAWFEAWTWWA